MKIVAMHLRGGALQLVIYIHFTNGADMKILVVMVLLLIILLATVKKINHFKSLDILQSSLNNTKLYTLALVIPT